jgi:hypothetical protein
MYICIYVYIYVCTYTQGVGGELFLGDIHVRIGIYAQRYQFMHTSINRIGRKISEKTRLLNICICMCVYVYIYMSVNLYICLCIHINEYVCVCMYIYVYT